MAGEEVLVGALALIAIIGVALVAARRPILLRLGLRNFGRRRGEAVVVVLGLMIGTAIISSSLVTGDSTSYGIRKNVYDALQEIDEIISISGSFFFPRSAYDTLANDTSLAGRVDALSPMILQTVAVASEGSGQSEAEVSLQGFDPALDRPFGAFRVGDSEFFGDDLGLDEVYVNRRLADAIEVAEGERVSVAYAKAPTPVIPKLYNLSGNLALATGAVGADGATSYTHSPVDQFSFPFRVERYAVSVTALLAWQPQPATDLDLELVGPAGEPVRNENGTAASPDLPVILNLSGPLSEGDWIANVHAKSARNQPFALRILVFYEVYDIETARRMAEELRRDAGAEAASFERALAAAPVPETRNFIVARVVDEAGKGGQFLTPSVFLRLEAAQTMLGKEGEINLIKATNPGGVEEGADGSREASFALNASLARLKEGDSGASVVSLRVVALKADYIAAADRAGELFSQLLTLLGSFTILAGIMLIVNIFVMLAEERRVELGISRAIGLKRSHLVMMLVSEGAVYAVAAAAAGAFAGLGLSYALLQAFNGIWSSNISLEIPFHPRPESLIIAFAAGILISLAAILFTSTRVARLNIVRAIRLLDEAPERSGPNTLLLGVGLGAAGLVVSAYGVATGGFSARVLGPPVLLFGLLLVSGRFTRDPAIVPIFAGAIFAYTLWTVFAIPPAGGTEGIAMGPARGLILVLSATTLIVSGRGPLATLARPLYRVKGQVAVARVASSYPLEKRFRTGLTVAMFALVLLVVILFSILFSILTPNFAEQSGGYDIRASSTVPVEELVTHLRSRGADESVLAGVDSAANTLYAEVPGGNLIKISGKPVRYRGPPRDFVYGIDENFRDTADFSFEELAPEYPSQREAYAALLARDDVIVISRIYTFDDNNQPGGRHVGEVLTMELPGGSRNFMIIGIQSQVYYEGVFVGRETLKRDFSQLHGQYLIKTAPGVDARAKARELEAAFQDIGMNAVAIQEDVADYIRETRQLYTLFQVYLGLGLVVGVASLGIITARAVIERRQEMGMLRAIGFTRRMIHRAFLLEALLTTSLGIVAGLLIGIVVAYGVFEQSLKSLGITFSLPYADMALILAVAYLATLAATYWPARGASKISPAEAIRYIE